MKSKDEEISDLTEEKERLERELEVMDARELARRETLETVRDIFQAASGVRYRYIERDNE